MQLRLHNTLTRTKEVFEPADPKNVRLYACGPTVYQRIHVGNARMLVVFDVLYRLLRHIYGERHVTYVRNITDVEDKIIAQAQANGESIGDLTERTTRQFHEDAAALGCLPPTHEPRATEHIPGMIALIEELIAKGHAYAAQGHVLFHVPSMPAYGRLSGRDRAGQIDGARVEVAPYKRDPADFVLWKPSGPDQPGWDSPPSALGADPSGDRSGEARWGRGRPGWHIECSAMSEALLGPLPFDIHGGGIDLIFPHHENEIAQSCCARDVDRMARVWMHNGFVDMRGQKMAKSVGNVVRVDEALALVPGEAIRLWLLGTHYRQPADYSEEALVGAKRTLDRFYGAIDRIAALDKGEPDIALVEALADDLNTPKALAVLHEQLTELNRTGDPTVAAKMRASAHLLGILQSSADSWRQGYVSLGLPLAEDIAGLGSRLELTRLIELRTEARKAGNFAEADRIRDELKKHEVILEDRPDGTTDWRRA